MLILISFLAVNTILFLGAALAARSMVNEPLVPIEQIAMHVSVDSQWNVSANREAAELLRGANAWAMVLDDEGAVIWEDSMPEHLARSYTPADVAGFTRWYLDEYPVLVQLLSKGLLVIGCSPNSITKLNYVMDTSRISPAVYGIFFFIAVNILWVLILFWRSTRKVERAIVPILDSISAITRGEFVMLPEDNELAEINAELNRASGYINKKDRARIEWINGISHDARTPLSIMLGYAGEMEDSRFLPPDTREKAGIIRQQGEKIRQLITDLNLTSRLEYSMQPLCVEMIYSVELARQVVSSFINSGLNDRHPIEFEADPDVNTETMPGDPSLLSRMLGNLIQNSISHNPDGCCIHVSINKESKGFRYTVADDGSGLSEEQLERFNSGIFSESNDITNEESVHGFGLKLVHQIVRAHNGTVHFEPVCPTGLSVQISLCSYNLNFETKRERVNR